MDEPEKLPNLKKGEELSKKEVLGDYIKDAVGYDNGVLNTLIDLRKNPQKVVNGYLAKSGEYVSPFKIFMIIITIWVVVMNFFLDWHAIGAKVFDQIFFFMGTYIFNKDMVSEMKEAEYIDLRDKFANLFYQAYTKWIVIFMIIIIPLTALVVEKLCKKYEISFQKHFAVTAYYNAMAMITGFVVSLFIAINFWITLLIMMTISLLGLLGFTKIQHMISLAPIHKFFEKDGKAIEKKYSIAALIIVSIVGMISIVGGFFYGRFTT